VIKNLKLLPAALAVTLLILVGCGGGGSSSSGAAWSGIKQFGATSTSTAANSITTDASGNIYVAGLTSGGLDGNTVAGASDFFLVKYSSSGTKRYTKQLGATGQITAGNSVATDASGNVYVAGFTMGGLDGNTLTGAPDIFLIKYSSDGTRLYTKQLGVAGTGSYALSVATDASSNVYVAGYTSGGLDSNTLTGTADFFLVKYNSSGTKLYTKQLGATGKTTVALSIATDASGNIYVAGYTNGGLDGNTLTGTNDFFLTKYSSDGTRLYTKQHGVASAITMAYSVATDASGNVYITGYTMDGLDGNTQTGIRDFFVTQYNSGGTRLYTRQLGAAGASARGSSVATDPSGNVYVAGSTGGGLGGNTQTGGTDAFVAKYSGGVLQ
jgi:hypothetical protein